MKHISLLFCSFLPFVFFAFGYYGAYRLLGVQTVSIPALTGVRILDVASTEASRLPIRIREVVEDAHLEEGTIIRHYPETGQLVKIQQPLELIITRKPQQAQAPQLVGLTQEQAIKKAEALGLRCKFYPYSTSLYPAHMCVAQYPNCDQELTQKTIILYISTGGEKMRLVPDFSGITIQEVAEFLDQFKNKDNKLLITYQVVPSKTASLKEHDSDSCKKRCLVKEQKPLAGSFWDISKSQLLQLSVEHQENN